MDIWYNSEGKKTVLALAPVKSLRAQQGLGGKFSSEVSTRRQGETRLFETYGFTSAGSSLKHGFNTENPIQSGQPFAKITRATLD